MTKRTGMAIAMALQLTLACEVEIPEGAKRCDSPEQCREVQGNLRYCRPRVHGDLQKYCFSSPEPLDHPPVDADSGVESDGAGAEVTGVDAASASGSDDATGGALHDAGSSSAADAARESLDGGTTQSPPRVDASAPASDGGTTIGRPPRAELLQASVVDAGAAFGLHIAAAGKVLVVGSPNHDRVCPTQSDPNPATTYRRLGAAFVFVQEADGWRQDGCLSPVDPQDGWVFGRAVAIDETGTRVVVAAPRESGSNRPGATFLYERSNDGWTWRATFRDIAASALAIRGDTVVVGAPWMQAQDQVYVFKRRSEDNSDWLPPAVLTGGSYTSGVPAGEISFGDAVALADDVLVVGDQVASKDVTGDAAVEQGVGAVYVYRRAPGGTFQDPPKRLEFPRPSRGWTRFGSGLAVDGSRIVVGAPGADPASGDGYELGAVHIFSTDGTRVDTLQPSITVSHHACFGFRVALRGTTLLVGAPGEGAPAGGTWCENYPGSGAAYLYELGSDDMGAPKRIAPSDLRAGDRFGASVALTHDRALVGWPGAGRIVANVAAPEHTGAGAVYSAPIGSASAP